MLPYSLVSLNWYLNCPQSSARLNPHQQTFWSPIIMLLETIGKNGNLSLPTELSKKDRHRPTQVTHRFEVRKICREGEHQRFCRIQVKPQEREVTSDIFSHVCALISSTLSLSLKHGWSNKNPIDCFHNYHPINFYQNVHNFAVISYNFQHCVCSFIKW